MTALRTGAVAAVAAEALAGRARSAAVIGCGVNGAWAARCLAAAGFGPGVCHDADADAAARLADELGWRAGRARRRWPATSSRASPRATRSSSTPATCGPGIHLNMLGADGPGKAEATVGAVASCALFCDEWAQASHGGELTGAVEAGLVTREHVTDLGAVLDGRGARPAGPERGHAVRLDRPGDPGPGDRRRGARGLARGPGARGPGAAQRVTQIGVPTAAVALPCMSTRPHRPGPVGRSANDWRAWRSGRRRTLRPLRWSSRT